MTTQSVEQTLSLLFSFLRCLMPSLCASTCCLRRGESTTCSDPARAGGIPAWQLVDFSQEFKNKIPDSVDRGCSDQIVILGIGLISAKK